MQTLPQSRLRAAWIRYLEPIHAIPRMNHEARRRHFRRVPQYLWDRHSALLLAAGTR